MRFFFSSRRRHTRLQGDWSSDVCSSDLDEAPGERVLEHDHRRRLAHRVLGLPAAVAQDLFDQRDQLADLHHVLSLLAPPSPERRAAEPCEAAPTLNTMKDQTVQELRIEVRRL